MIFGKEWFTVVFIFAILYLGGRFYGRKY